ncbi:CYTH domain-containing protein [Corynebacterium pseudopelargi]|uniref:CYTH domain protein n=1 Tax=Corynebacterium pseudopelargi TaxID=2080757 RepID=A0A3G6ITD7_9CORY|nr:CYTH domain-containing protein [Corynebacterium pseudopelargi]AZA08857.1 CYTH domain protein [Corynebacterium pseudopelargi]
MSPKRTVEQEIKFDVDASQPDAELTEIMHVSAIGDTTTMELDARYFDTEDLLLAANKITLRRRVGGKDAGWHLKTTGEHGREELQCPLGDAMEVPHTLREEVAGIIGQSALKEVARIRNRRVETLLIGASGEVVAEFCDDHVTATSENHQDRWREWEVELREGALEAAQGEELLQSAARMLQAQGAHKAARASKLQRALGKH